MRESWTDARLDDFRGETARRFDEVDRRFDRVESDIREMRGEIVSLRVEMSEGFKSMQRMMLYGVVALSAAIITGFGAMAGLLGS